MSPNLMKKALVLGYIKPTRPKDIYILQIYMLYNIHSLSVRWPSNSFLFHVSVTSFGG